MSSPYEGATIDEAALTRSQAVQEQIQQLTQSDSIYPKSLERLPYPLNKSVACGSLFATNGS